VLIFKPNKKTAQLGGLFLNKVLAVSCRHLPNQMRILVANKDEAKKVNND
jgi:hypothetical protein